MKESKFKEQLETIKLAYAAKINEVCEKNSQEWKLGFLAGWELCDQFGRELGQAAIKKGEGK